MKHLLFFTYLAISMCSNQVLGQFEAQVIDAEISIGYGLSIGDVNGDNKPDILLADKAEIVYYQNGDWNKHILSASLTQRDHVCISARDLNGDGMVEIAVGAQWNPGNTNNAYQSGSVHLLEKAEKEEEMWPALSLYHEPTIHRMHWVKVGEEAYQLLVLPLHGIGNTKGEGQGVNMLVYPWAGPGKSTQAMIVPTGMHMTHNFDIIEETDETASILIGGKEGVKRFSWSAGQWQGVSVIEGRGFGEVRLGKGKQQSFIAGIEPLHGNILSVHEWGEGDSLNRTILTENLKQGHGLACADVLGTGEDQIIVGWRNPNEAGKVGIRFYARQGNQNWNMHVVDDNVMACEDLKVADLDGDGKAEIIAAGRASHNVIIYWNRN